MLNEWCDVVTFSLQEVLYADFVLKEDKMLFCVVPCIVFYLSRA